MANDKAEISEVKNIVYKVLGVVFSIAIAVIAFFTVRTLNSYDENNKRIEVKIEDFKKEMTGKFDAVNQIQNDQNLQGQRMDFLDYRLNSVEKVIGLDPLYQKSKEVLEKTKQYKRK